MLSLRFVSALVIALLLPAVSITHIRGFAVAQECSLAVSCSDKAWSVSPFPPCVCKCRHGFGGAKCDRCTTGFAPIGACNSCAAGYSRFPLCVETSCTNVNDGCNFKGVNISGTAGNCTCTCLPGYRGARCEQCDVGRDRYPLCLDACTNVGVSCGPFGRSVSGNSTAECICVCKVGYTGAQCDMCADGFVDFPLCSDGCSNTRVSCSDRASAVNPDVQSAGGCNCTCLTGFSGGRCELCAPGFGAWPLCVADLCVSNAVSCSGNAAGPPRFDVSSGQCNCTCRRGFAGARCDRCAPLFADYPTCYDSCVDSVVSCSGRALNMTLVGTTCHCTCPRQFTGPRCEFCARGYEPPSCLVESCTSVEGNCEGHASNVSRNADGTCKCVCHKQYSGVRCELCAAGYSQYALGCLDACKKVEVSCGFNGNFALNVSGNFPTCVCSCRPGYDGLQCNRCAENFGGFPSCVRSTCQSPRVSCNSFATAVSGTAPPCFCSCFVGYAGVSCERCSLGFAGWPDCRPDCTTIAAACGGPDRATKVIKAPNGQCLCACISPFGGPTCGMCAVGFFDDAGTCKEDCTSVVASCNSNAFAVSGAPPTCRCTCKPNYQGARCNACAIGYIAYPICEVDSCLGAASCHFHGRVTGGTPPTCFCSCDRGYSGARCDSCAFGFTGYPSCIGDCTSAESCHGKAKSFYRHSNGTCVCECFLGFSGASCDRCALGYAEWPNCIPDCTSVVTACSDRAFIVDGLPGACVCYCIPPYAGAKCNECAPGLGGFPVCDVSSDCRSVWGSCSGPNHAYNVTVGAEPGTCDCHCRPEYTGSKCELCKVGFTFDTNGTDPNTCVEACNNSAVSCNGNAVSVSGFFGRCACVCKTGFSGDRCQRCALGYGGYPRCFDACELVAVSCMPVATAVIGYEGNCQCTCPPRIGGSKCQQCLVGFTSYPTCHEACTDASVSCNGHGVSVSGSYPDCVCTVCQRGFTGSRCDRCAFGFINYPLCLDRCTVSITCSGNAHAVSGSNGNCSCACRTGYVGPQCDRCASGYSGYPTCKDACTVVGVSCGPNAVAVAPRIIGCNCTCRAGWGGALCEECFVGWTGPNCDRCDVGYTGALCDSCRSGYSGFPQCTEDCTNLYVSCSGNARNVSSASVSSGPRVCLCLCDIGYDGDKCQRCAVGYDGFPICVDSCKNVTVSCGGRALDVSGSNGVCQCLCLPQFTGILCDECKVGYAGWPTCFEDCTSVAVSCGPYGVSVSRGADAPLGAPCMCTCVAHVSGRRCDSCVANYTGFPNCFDACVDIRTSCGHGDPSVLSRVVAVQPTATPGACNCTCAPAFAGPVCDRCAAGHTGFPACLDDCSSVSVSCGSNALRAFNGTLWPKCSCTCKPGFAGERCAQCSPRVSSYPLCNMCHAGYTSWPQCVDACVDVSITCPVGARSIDVARSSPGNCTCACLPAFMGSTCDRCASGYDGWPTCTDACLLDRVSCHDIGTIVHGRGGGDGGDACVCFCPPRFSGKKCERCEVGYGLWPRCLPDCSVVSLSCNETFTSTVFGSPGNCSCGCKPGFAGPRCERCADGFSGFPNCRESCDNPTVSCFGKGLRVWGTYPTCQCECVSDRYNATLQCGVCAAGYEVWPTCSNACTNSTSTCIGPSVGVSKGRDGTCVCECASRAFSGSLCERCANGYSGFPACQDSCTDVGVSCNGNAISVSGQPGNCSCRCKPAYRGLLCDSCSEGFSGYPACFDSCRSVNISCAGNAVAVSGTPPVCICICHAGFGGLKCESCLPGFEGSGWPHCFDSCTLPSVSCALGGSTAINVSVLEPPRRGTNQSQTSTISGNADQVAPSTPASTPQRPTCICGCRVPYAGRLCDQCMPGFSGFPHCFESCDNVNVSCNNHAIRVSGSNGACQCTCKPGYTGARCNACADGFAGFPGDCVDQCTVVEASCTSFAISVRRVTTLATPEYNATYYCQCTCVPLYVGRKCDECANGYSGFPRCVSDCSNTTVACAGGFGVAVRRNSTDATKCVCTCRKGYGGDICDACAPGFRGFPNCTGDCTTVEGSCNDHATAVTGVPPLCSCTCETRFGGPTCDRCSRGYHNYPACEEACEVTICGGRGINVTYSEPPRNESTGNQSVNDNTTSNPDANATTTVNRSCLCVCVPRFSGSRCERCADGFVGFPTCADVCGNVSCNNRGTPFRANDGSCACSCHAKNFSGSRCDVCGLGYRGYPNCVLVADECSCGGRGTVVSSSPSPRCLCACYERFTGSECQLCAAGFGTGGFPTCLADTPSPVLSAQPKVVLSPVPRAPTAKDIRASRVVVARMVVAASSGSFAGDDASPRRLERQQEVIQELHSHQLLSRRLAATEEEQPSQEELRQRSAFFSSCVFFTPLEEVSDASVSPFGFAARRSVLISPSESFALSNGTLAVTLMPDSDFSPRRDETVRVTFGQACFTNRVSPNASVLFTIRSTTTEDADLVNVMTGVLGATASAAVVGGGAAVADLQAVVVLGMMSCSPASSRSLALSLEWVLSPASVSVDSLSSKLLLSLGTGAAVTAVHGFVVLVFFLLGTASKTPNVARTQRRREVSPRATNQPTSRSGALRPQDSPPSILKRTGSAETLRVDQQSSRPVSSRTTPTLFSPPPLPPSGTGSTAAAAAARFPALAAFAVFVLNPSFAVFSFRLLREDGANAWGTLIGIVGLMVCSAVCSIVAMWSARKPPVLVFRRFVTRVPPAVFAVRPARRFFFTCGEWSPHTIAGRMFGLAFGDLRDLRFGSFSLWMFFAVVGCSSFVPTTATRCAAQFGGIAALYTVAAIVVAVFRPYASPFLNFIAVLTRVAVALMFAAAITRDDSFTLGTTALVAVVSWVRAFVLIVQLFIGDSGFLVAPTGFVDEEPGRAGRLRSPEGTPQHADEDKEMAPAAAVLVARPSPSSAEPLLQSARLLNEDDNVENSGAAYTLVASQVPSNPLDGSAPLLSVPSVLNAAPPAPPLPSSKSAAPPCRPRRTSGHVTFEYQIERLWESDSDAEDCQQKDQRASGSLQPTRPVSAAAIPHVSVASALVAATPQRVVASESTIRTDEVGTTTPAKSATIGTAQHVSIPRETRRRVTLDIDDLFDDAKHPQESRSINAIIDDELL